MPQKIHHATDTVSVITVLTDELQDANVRYLQADNEGKKEVKRQILEIQRDIKRNTMKLRGERI